MAGTEQVRARALVCDVSELTNPDVAVVDALARLELAASRRGCKLRLCEPTGSCWTCCG